MSRVYDNGIYRDATQEEENELLVTRNIVEDDSLSRIADKLGVDRESALDVIAKALGV